MKKRDRLIYISYQILDQEKRVYGQGIPTLKEARIQLKLMGEIAHKRDKVVVQTINENSIKINGTLFYIFNSTPRVQY